MKIAIFTDNKYGALYIRKIIKRISETFNVEIAFSKTYTPAMIEKCRPSLERKIKAILKDVDKVFIIVDIENVREWDENRLIWKHFKDLEPELMKKIILIATEPELEEWICISLDLKFDKTGLNVEFKPSRVLEERFGYKKYEILD